MKALYLRTHYWFNLKAGGSIAHTAGVINSLKKFVELEVISNERLPEVEHEVKIIEPVKIGFLLKGVNELLYNLKLIKVLNYNNYDFIYQRFNGYSFCGAYLSKKWSVPLILEFNSSDVWKIKHWKSKSNIFKRTLKFFYDYIVQLPIVSLIENYNLKQASLIVVVSKAMKEELVKRGIDESKILVNPNGVDVEKFNPNIYFPEIKQEYGLEDKIVLGFIGTFGQWHGTENIVRAYGKLLQEYSEYKEKTRLFMIGDGVKMPEVKENIKKYNIADNVILTGLIPQEEAPKYLSVCDILINATVPNPDGSEFFGSPTKLFEYMAMGKAIISSDLGQMGEILENEKTALLVKGGDIEDLKNAIKRLVDDKNLREKLGRSARKEVEEKYTWDKHVERILKAIQRVKDVK